MQVHAACDARLRCQICLLIQQLGDSQQGAMHEICNISHAQGDWGTQFGMLIQHLDDSREGGLAGGAAEEDVKDLQARLQPLCVYPG